MTHLNTRRLFGLIGAIAVLGLAFVVGQAATIDCEGQFKCVGTQNDDTLRAQSGGDTAEVRGIGGNDTIVINASAFDQEFQVFGGSGKDHITWRGNDDVTIFGDTGDDFVELRDGKTARVDAGRGDDMIQIADNIDDDSLIKDGPGTDVIRGRDNGSEINLGDVVIRLDGDNDQDTVVLDLNDSSDDVVILLSRRSGRDVIQCTNPNGNEDPTGTVMLNGNRKAIDPFGNNLFDAARFGGTAETGCAQVIR